MLPADSYSTGTPPPVGYAYVRIVDKHSSAMWAFCKQWAWDQHIKFVTDEGYARVAETPDQVKKRLKMRVSAGVESRNECQSFFDVFTW